MVVSMNNKLYNKIGFHAGPAGNHNGIGEYYKRLDAAGIPFVIKSVDHYGHIHEACQYTNADHIRVFRLSGKGQGDGYNYDIPNYHLSANLAADLHWEKTMAALPPEFNKDLVWLEPINEVDKNRVEWLSEFAMRFSALAIQNGYKILMYAWSPGEPEINHWTGPWMKRYLELCSELPNQFGIALHEYSLTAENIWDDMGYKIGRFEMLFEVCSKLGLNHPTTVMTEWGWTLNNLPSIRDAMNDIMDVNEFYCRYKAVKGACIWYLGGGPEWKDIQDQTQKLIAPVTEYSLNFDGSGVPVDFGHNYSWPTEITDDDSPFLFEPYTRYGLLYPQNTSKNDLLTTIDALNYKLNQDIGFFSWSHQDSFEMIHQAVMRGKTDSRLYILDGERIGTGINKEWVADNFVELSGYIEYISSEDDKEQETKPLIDITPSAPPAGFGIHMSATPWIDDTEINLLNDLNPSCIKVLSFHDPVSLAKIRNLYPNATYILRSFLDFGGRNITPDQFVRDTVNDMNRSLDVLRGTNVIIEIHNEPNLVAEGYNAAWNSGATFNVWYMDVLRKYRKLFPNNRMIFPGVSPGSSINGIRPEGHEQFLSACRSAIDASDGLGVHSYWGWDNGPYPMLGNGYSGVTMIDRIRESFQNKDFWITEASNNHKGSFTEKGKQYKQFLREVGKRYYVKGVNFYVTSAHPDTFQKEIWISDGKSTGIKEGYLNG